MNTVIDKSKHPCFNEDVKGICGRVHLPVAPKCNIKCNYCDRRYDCVNESRPGVTTAVLRPEQAVGYLDAVLSENSDITVVGIAGPGDPLANPEETFATLRAIREEHPEMLFCLSTNGLALPAHVKDLVELGVSHVTVTVNAVDPTIGAKVYGWVRDGKVIHRGEAAARLMWERHSEGISALKEAGVIVKVNTILIPTVNDRHIEAIAKELQTLGVDVLNVMALVPNAGTPFGELPEPGHEDLRAVRSVAEEYLPQMKHCQRCRADAVGLLGQDQSEKFGAILTAFSSDLGLDISRPYVAVATREGLLVNQHLGEADSFQIWAKEGGEFKLVETRQAPDRGDGVDRWRSLGKLLSDCRAVLVSGFGEAPNAVLTSMKVPPIEVSGFISMALEPIFEGKGLEQLKKRRSPGCSKGFGCGGDGGGCG
ncbi:MAG: nitrogen fixation protein NifB [Deltaproteobacteria bacterium]|nr:MAG: nitrogen fixation protein NifB [Deltaproteobacteria bacterium]